MYMCSYVPKSAASTGPILVVIPAIIICEESDNSFNTDEINNVNYVFFKLLSFSYTYTLYLMLCLNFLFSYLAI